MVFFFQAEDGIRDYKVTGVQTCALPIFDYIGWWMKKVADEWYTATGEVLDSVDVITHSTGGVLARSYVQSTAYGAEYAPEIGRASCRERETLTGVDRGLDTKIGGQSKA